MDFEPKWIAWEITRRCNLKCVHCRSSSELAIEGHPDFSFDEAKRVIDDIASYASPVIVLSGGEPLLREDVFDIARYGNSKGLRMCLATNGTLVTPEICKNIKDAGIKMVSLSLDGAKASTHDDFRNQPGAFDGTMNAIKLFNEYGIPFLINSSFTIRNRKEIPEIYKLVKGLGAKAWYMFMIVPTGRGEDIMDELIPIDLYDEILEWHYEIEKNDDELLTRPTCAPHYYRIVRQKAKEEHSSFKRRNLQFSPVVPKAVWPVSSSVLLMLILMCSPAATFQNLQEILRSSRSKRCGKTPGSLLKCGISKDTKTTVDPVNT